MDKSTSLTTGVQTRSMRKKLEEQEKLRKKTEEQAKIRRTNVTTYITVDVNLGKIKTEVEEVTNGGEGAVTGLGFAQIKQEVEEGQDEGMILGNEMEVGRASDNLEDAQTFVHVKEEFEVPMDTAEEMEGVNDNQMGVDFSFCTVEEMEEVTRKREGQQENTLQISGVRSLSVEEATVVTDKAGTKILEQKIESLEQTVQHGYDKINSLENKLDWMSLQQRLLLQALRRLGGNVEGLGISHQVGGNSVEECDIIDLSLVKVEAE